MIENNRKIEVLAPAGNMEALKAAVFAGCDAVYLGGSLFSARANAVNFSNDELIEVVSFAHIRGVKVYVTVNTLLKDSEIEEAMSFVSFLANIGVDGILVQDLGLFRLINEHCPDIPLHSSTQMSIFSPMGAKLLCDMGADRVVLARELSLNEIKEIHEYTDVELEAFVHGALCMSVSGQCYFSAMLGSRSGNRGRCAQTCRLPFSTDDGFSNVLSLKDMSFINNISELSDVGVISAKIEGRMKRPEYVAASVKSTGFAADGLPIPTELSSNLEAVFSRSGFTNAYLRGKMGPDMFGIRTKDDVTASTSAVFGQIHQLYRGEAGRIPVYINFTLYSGEFPVLNMSDRLGNEVTVTREQKAETANNRPLDEERIRAQLSKLGATPYYAEDIYVSTDNISILSMSVLNELRRCVCEELSLKRAAVKSYPFTDYSFSFTNHYTNGVNLRGVFSNINEIPENAKKLQYVYLPLSESTANFLELKKDGYNVAVNMPRAFFGGEKEVKEKVIELINNNINVFLCGNIGSVAIVKECGGIIHGSFSMNIANSESLVTAKKIGISETEVSFELTNDEISSLKGDIPRGIMAYGRQALMLTRACPIGHGRCINCSETHYLTDRKGTKFPVMCMKGNGFRATEVLNSVPLNISDRQKEFRNIDFMILRFTTETKDESEKIINDFYNHSQVSGEYTRGLYYRGVF